MKWTLFCLHFTLLAVFAGCASTPLESRPVSSIEPVMAESLNSQLLDRANLLARDFSGENQVCLLDISYDALVARIHL